jgi:hypothetical protein
MMTPLTLSEAIRTNNARDERQFMSDHKKRQKRARAQRQSAWLRCGARLRHASRRRRARRSRQRVLRPRRLARAAVEAGRALQALEAELREAPRMEVGDDYAGWHLVGLGGVFVALAARNATGAVGNAGSAKRDLARCGRRHAHRCGRRWALRPLLWPLR